MYKPNVAYYNYVTIKTELIKFKKVQLYPKQRTTKKKSIQNCH